MADPRLQAIMEANPGIDETQAARALVEAMGQVKTEASQRPSMAQTASSWFNEHFGNVVGTGAAALDQVVNPILRGVGATDQPAMSIADAQAKAKGMLPSTPGGVGAMGATMLASPFIAGALPAAPVAAAGARIGTAMLGGTGGAMLGGEASPIAEGAKQGAYAATGELIGPALRLFQAGLVRAQDAKNLGSLVQSVIPAFRNNGTAQDLYEIAKGVRGFDELRAGFDQGQKLVEGLAGGPQAVVAVPAINKALGLPPNNPMTLGEAFNEVKKLGEAFRGFQGPGTYEKREAYRQAQQEITAELNRLNPNLNPGQQGAGPAATIYSAIRDRFSKGMEIMGLLNSPEAFIGSPNRVRLNMQSLQTHFGNELADFQKRGLQAMEGPLYRGGPIGSADAFYGVPLRGHPKAGIPVTVTAPHLGINVFTGQPTGPLTPQSIVTPATQAVGNAVER